MRGKRAALSVKVKRDAVDVLVESVIVCPEKDSRTRWAAPHRIKIRVEIGAGAYEALLDVSACLFGKGVP